MARCIIANDPSHRHGAGHMDLHNKVNAMGRITVSVNDACCLIGIKRTKLYQLINEKSLQVVKIGRRTLVKVASIEALVGAQEVM